MVGLGRMFHAGTAEVVNDAPMAKQQSFEPKGWVR